MMQKINWAFEDPSAFAGSQEERLAATRTVRDKIKEAVQEFVRQVETSTHLES
jgi:arsenate reductase